MNVGMHNKYQAQLFLRNVLGGVKHIIVRVIFIILTSSVRFFSFGRLLLLHSFGYRRLPTIKQIGSLSNFNLTYDK